MKGGWFHLGCLESIYSDSIHAAADVRLVGFVGVLEDLVRSFM